ncbi:hypothetical protein LTR49_008388 [Elasticomyces elasticus]|nr:hypothetical protein LTR49_008388 [Elasticomyces elasticus]
MPADGKGGPENSRAFHTASQSSDSHEASSVDQPGGRPSNPEQYTQHSIQQTPAISIPKGGGAISNIGEKFSSNLATGTGSLSVPIAASTGREGFTPQLTLAYDSGNGNGPFGMGWHLSLPNITRKTDKGLPRYQDADESDVFILSGSEDLIPVYQVDQNGKLIIDGSGKPVYEETIRGGYTIRYYRPRVEGLFARIERWTRQADGEIYWRSITRDNITTLYGNNSNSRITSQTDSPIPGPKRTFSWLVCETYDAKGNTSIYKYKEEDSANVPVWRACESNRTDQTRSANRYLKSIQYGNRLPNRDSAWVVTDSFALPDTTWMFQLVFDYCEHDIYNPTPTDTNLWACRDDPISSYRSGFEVRTYRLCRRVLMFHSFPDQQVAGHSLVQSMDFSYSHGPVISFMTSIVRSGYSPQSDPQQQTQYIKRSFPPLDFEYSQPPTSEQLAQLPVRAVDADSLENLPYGVDGSMYSWVDLDGDGLSGIITQQSGGWFYKRNLSANLQIMENGTEKTLARFGPLEYLMSSPAITCTPPQFMDLAGEGRMDIVLMDGLLHGFYKRTADFDWLSLRSFSSWPNIDTRNPNLKFVDLNGDGFADILITENDVFTWYPSLAEDGYGPPVTVSQAMDGDEGPRLVLADAEGAIFLADLSGDGLNDLLRIRNGEVTYWPNLGYGYFGSRVSMDNAPWFDHPDQFNHSRIRITDIDGSGTSDIIYLGRETVDIYRNQAGNGWSDADKLQGMPPGDQMMSVTTIDLLGAGTTCLVWSSSMSGAASRQPMHYVDIMDGRRPHLLTKFVNNMGSETCIQYRPSTFFFEQDRDAGTPWVTRLSFPVQCVERVDTFDRISRNHFVSRYAYHHGFFDGIEREFNGFGMVEQWDAEEYGALNDMATIADSQTVDAASNVPPIHTKTWFHTGAFFDQDTISWHMAHEYFGAPTSGDVQFQQFHDALLPDTILPSVPLTADEMREASRSLKGSILRKEVYAEDGTSKASVPYSVSESNFTIMFLQPQGNNPHSIFFKHPRESVSFNCERNMDDPRVSHNLVLEVDRYGNELRSVAIGYGRQPGRSPLTGDDKAKQEHLLSTYTEKDVTNPIYEPDDYCAPTYSGMRSYEISGFVLPNGAALFSFDTFAADGFARLQTLNEIPFEQDNNPHLVQKRLLSSSRMLYRSNDLSHLLPPGQVESMALPGVEYKLAFTPGLISQVFRRRNTNGSVDNLLPNPANMLGGRQNDQAGLVNVDNDGHWWVPSGRVYYHPNVDATPAQELLEARGNFFLQRRFTDQFDNSATVEYDENQLLLVRTQDSMGNKVKCKNDYRVLEPVVITDPNGNGTAIAFDALGLVAGTAVMGKTSETLGDNLDGFVANVSSDDIKQFFLQPKDPQIGAKLLGGATTRIIYDVTRYWLELDPQERMPVFAVTLSRESHTSDGIRATGLKIQVNFAYSDGFGREIEHKVQAEPGAVEGVAGTVAPRWVGTGWTIYNNKGKPVRQYEPFFDDTHEFSFSSIRGVSPVVFYDAMERAVGTLHPDHSWEKVVFDPWQQTSYDRNDSVLADPKTDPDVGYFFDKLQDKEYQPTWYDARKNGQLGSNEKSAAAKAIVHANTPAIAYSDSLGRTFLTVVDNGTYGKYETRTALDIQGNQRAAIDAKGRAVMRHDYNMLKTHIHQVSMEGGERWTLNNGVGVILLAWNSRKFRTRTEYDGLHRHIGTYLQEGTGSEKQVERIVYGETLPSPETNNQRGKSVQIFDQAGVVTNDEYDFKGNSLRSQRQFAQEYKEIVDWTASPPLNASVYSNQSRYDALNRVVELTAPDSSITRLVYSEANMPDQIHVNVRGEQTNGRLSFTPFVTNADYDAKGQRTLVEYGNGARTTFAYDPYTFRITDLQTQRGGNMLQKLHYTYDPVGNITYTEDTAKQTVFFRNRRVEPSADYTYDAVYRLIAATGREHMGINSGSAAPDAFNKFQSRLVQTGDGNALGNYTETYIYDAVDNILAMKHASSDSSKPGWTRSYAYNESSQLDANQKSNRLSSTSVGSATENYSYASSAGLHGSMSLPHLSAMEWDYKDQLHRTARQVVNSGTPESTWYVYDGSGQRTRKITEKQAASGEMPTRLKERIYLGIFEIYREHAADGTTVNLERETLNVMDQNTRVALIETRTQGEDQAPEKLTRFQLGNLLGTAVLELDGQAQIISYEEYFPFGATSYQAVRSQTETPKRYRYTGKERDEESGLYYHGARYYACWLGRWTACDPKDTADGDNLYRYVKNSPITHNDPTGTLSWGQVAGIATAVVVGTVVTVATAGLAGPVIGAAAAAVVGGIVGGAAGGAVSAAVETKIDNGAVNWKAVGTGALVNGVTGGVLAGGGQALSAVARSSVGKAIGTGLAESGAGRFVAKVANSGPAQAVGKVPDSAVGWAAKTSVGKAAKAVVENGIAKPLAALHEAAEGLGTRFSLSAGIGKAAQQAALRNGEAAAVSSSLQKGAGSNSTGGRSPSEGLPGGTLPAFVAPTAVTPESQMGWRNLKLSEATPSELELWDGVLKAEDVIIGRSLNVKQQGQFVLDNWLEARGIQWTQRWQDVYNRSLSDRLVIARQPVNVMAGGGYTLGEVTAAESGARSAGLFNRPFWGGDIH